MTDLNIGNKIRELRKKKGITQEALATALSVSPQAVSKWESGLTFPDMTMILIIAGYFEISLDVLFDYDIKEMKNNIQKIIDDAWECFYSDTAEYIITIKKALKDYPDNEALLTALIGAYEYDLRENGNSEHLDDIIELSHKLINESSDFPRVCSVKELLASAYLQKNDYEKAKQILETLPESIVLKNDAFAAQLKSKDKLNGAIMARCDHLQGLYIAAMREGDAWFRMDEYDVTFKDFAPSDYISEALKSYQKGLAVLEAYLIENEEGQNQYLWDGMQTFHWGFYQCVAACQKKLGNINECNKAIAKARSIISTAWNDYNEKRNYYMEPFNQYLNDYGLEDYIV